jgi:hypothetical protein
MASQDLPHSRTGILPHVLGIRRHAQRPDNGPRGTNKTVKYQTLKK